MQQNNTLMKALFVLLAALSVLACNAVSIGATSTPVPPAATNTPLPTNTPAATNTPLPTPTETAVPATPTPAPVGEAVRSASYEVTVVNARQLNRVYMGSYYYYPKTGNLAMELVVKVSNLTGSKASVPWKNVFVITSTGRSLYSNWSGFKAVSTGSTVDASTIGVNDTLDGTGTVDFEEDVYLRVIWFAPKTSNGTTFLFGFYDSPKIIVVIH